MLNTQTNKTLKKIWSIIQEKNKGDFNFEKLCYEVIIDMIDTRLYKPFHHKKDNKNLSKYYIPVKFVNKGFDFINLPRIIKQQDVYSLLPEIIQEADKCPKVVYSLTGTISNKVFNYKETVEKIDVEDKETYGTTINQCDCRTSEFRDTEYQHVITGDLRIIKNKKLRKLFAKGPNFREPRTIKWKICLEELKIGIEECSEKIIKDKKCDKNLLIPWKEAITKKAEEKIEEIKPRIKAQHTKPILKQNAVTTYLQELHNKFVIVPIDKAGSNIAIICKKFYVEKLLEEVGIIGEQSKTYEKTTNKDKKEIIQENVKYAES